MLTVSVLSSLVLSSREMVNYLYIFKKMYVSEIVLRAFSVPYLFGSTLLVKFVHAVTILLVISTAVQNGL